MHILNITSMLLLVRGSLLTKLQIIRGNTKGFAFFFLLCVLHIW
jgi:hypothetical protein